MISKMEEYISALLKANVSADVIEKTQAVIGATEEVCAILDSPSVPLSEKETAIGELFPKSIQGVLTEISEDMCVSDFDEIAKAYLAELDKRSNIVFLLRHKK